MDPNNNGASMNLPPQPAQELGVAAGQPPEAGQPVQAEMASVPAAPPPVAAPVSWVPPSVPVNPSGPADSPVGQGGTPVVPGVDAPDAADDGDVIEKEWVLKAKQIVEHTRQDPHMQTKQLHKFRAEYMKKRYNMTIEPVEE